MLKTGFRGERKGILTPFTYSPIRRLLPRRGGVVTSRERRKKRNVATEKRRKPPPLTYSALADFRPKGECGDGKNDYEIVNQRLLFLKTLIHTDNFLTFVRFRKL